MTDFSFYFKGIIDQSSEILFLVIDLDFNDILIWLDDYS